MRKLKKNHFIIVILAIVAFSLILFWSNNYYKKLKQPVIPVFSSIPDDVLFFIQFNKISKIWEKSSSNFIWNEIKKIQYFNELSNQIYFIDTLINSNEMLYSLLNDNSPILSFHNINAELYFLFLCNVPPNFDISDLKHIINKNSKLKISVEKTDNYKTLIINREGLSKPYFAGIFKGVFVGSFSKHLLQKALQKIFSSDITTNQDIESLKLTSGKKVDANIYVNFKNFSQYLASIFKNDFTLNTNNLNLLGSWAELDLLVKDSSFLLNGYTQPNKDSFTQNNVFSAMKPQNSYLADYIPQNTIGFISFIFDDFATYFAQYKKNAKKYSQFSDFEKKINSIGGYSVIDNFTEWMGNEYGVVLLPSNKGLDSFVVCKTNNNSSADSCLQNLAANSQKISNIKDKKFVRNKIAIQDLLKITLGDFCSSFPETFYEVTNDFVVFARSNQAIQNFKEAYLTGEVLSKTDSYKQFVAIIPSLSNIFLYFNFNNSYSFIKDNLVEKYQKSFQTNFSTIKNFNQLALQIGVEQHKWYTTLNFFYTKNTEKGITHETEKLTPGFNTGLTAKIISKPFIVKNTSTNENNIIVFDENNICYFINKEGNVKWHKNIDSKILGRVWEMDFYKNGKIQFLFNTENKLHLLDANGNYVENFPVKLLEQATCGLSLIDYDKKKNYRILIPTINKKILYLNSLGKSISDFSSPIFKDIISQPVQHIIFGNKDNILVAEISGKISILDRKGKPRIAIKSSIIKNRYGLFYYDGKYLITTDIDGKIIYISPEGKVDSKTFPQLKANYYFSYEDFNNDGNKDFICLEDKRLIVLNRTGKTIFDFNFDEKTEKEIVVYNSAKRGKFFAIRGIESNRIYVFNKSGLLDESLAFRSEAMPTFTNFANRNQVNLVGVVGNKVVVYSFE